MLSDPRISVQEQTLERLMSILITVGGPELTGPVNALYESHQTAMEDAVQRYRELHLEGKGPIQTLKDKMGSSKGGVNLIAYGKEQGHPIERDIRRLVRMTLRLDYDPHTCGTWDPYQCTANAKSIPESPENFESRIYVKYTSPGRPDTYYLVVGLEAEGIVPRGWFVVTLTGRTDTPFSLSYYTWHPVEKVWLCHNHPEVHALAHYRKGFNRLMKRYGHNPLNHPVSLKYVENMLQLLTLKHERTFSVIDDHQVTVTPEENQITIKCKGQPVEWENLSASTQRVILYNL